MMKRFHWATFLPIFCVCYAAWAEEPVESSVGNVSESGERGSGVNESGFDESGFNESGPDESGVIESGEDETGFDESGGNESGGNDSIEQERIEKSAERRNFLDRQRQVITQQLIGLTEALDRMLVTKKHELYTKNESYMILNIESLFSEAGNHEFSLRAKGKVDLPNTERRWKLIFESVPEEDFSPQDNERSGQIRNDELASERAVAGVEFSAAKERFEWQPSVDIGSRFDIPLDVFVRFRLRKETALSENWLLSTRFELPYFAIEGAKPSSRIGLRYNFNDKMALSTTTSYRYTRQEKLHEYFQSIDLDHLISERTALKYRVGAFGDSEPVKEVDTYFLEFGVKRLIYKDWMFLSLIPQINFSREDNWSPTHAFTMRLQMIYTE